MMRRKMRPALWAMAALLCLWMLFPARTGATQVNTKVAVECNLPPFQFVDATGKIAGLHVDIMNAIAKNGDLVVEYVPYETSSGAVKALRDGEVDAVLGVLPNDCSSEELIMTNDISSASISLIVNNKYMDRVVDPQPDSLRYTTAFELGTMTLSQISELNTRYTMIMGDQMQLYRGLTEGEVDSIAGVKESILYLFEQDADIAGESYTVVNNYMATVNYSILVRRSDRVLHSVLNSGISLLRNSGEYDRLVESWVPNADLLAAQTRISKLVKIILFILSVATLAVCAIYVWNIKLKSIVEEKTKEIKLRMQQLEQESLLRNLLIEHAPNSILLLREDGTVLLMNPRAKKVANRLNDPEADPPDDGRVHMEGLDIFGQIWAQTSQRDGLESMKSSAIIPLKNIRGDKKLFRYQYYALNADHDMVLMVEDVTQEERERTEMFEANKNQTLNRMIAGIAHEIKNPLMSIRAFASLIREQGSDEEFQTSFALYVPPEVDRINRLVESLINYARPVSGLKEHVAIARLVDECVYLTHASAKSKRIRYLSQTDVTACIYVNRDQLKQALINLLMNAIESVEEKVAHQPESAPVIRTRIYRRGAKVCVEILDEGMGMSEEALQNCAEPFYTTKRTGTGMGLSLAKQFVHENGGDFEIESKLNEFTLITMAFEEDTEA